MSAAPSRPDLADLRARYLAAQLSGDRREALRVVIREGLERGVSVRDLSDEVIGEAQREIGARWQRNEITIADEHMATAISNLVLAQLYERAAPAARNGKKILVACVEGELHELPARVVADALDLAGFSVRYLGASVPADSLLEMIETHRPDLVALSTTMTFHITALRAVVQRIRETPDGRLPIAVGGAACAWSPRLGEELGVDIVANDAPGLVEAAKRHFGVDS